MTRKEWRAYNKRMKALEWKNKKFPQRTTLEEMNELTKWYIEKAKRHQKAAIVPLTIAIVCQIIAVTCLIIKVVMVVTGR